ncbi:MAG: hypothetical protein ACYCW6_18525 [Candidatus Xenobia bacterium]
MALSGTTMAAAMFDFSRAIRSLHNVPRFFTDARTFSVLPQNRTWRPLVSTSRAIDYAAGHGLTPWGFHLLTFLLFLLLLALMVRWLEPISTNL